MSREEQVTAVIFCSVAFTLGCVLVGVLEWIG